MVKKFDAATDADLQSLSKEVESLKADRLSMIKDKYNDMSVVIYNAVQKTPVLEANYNALIQQQELTELFTALTEAANPTSDVLGFKFTDVVTKFANQSFTVEDKPKATSRLKTIIGELLTNPVVDSLVKANPITSAVSSIVQSVAGFSDATLKSEGPLKKDTIDTALPIQQNNIDNFKKLLAPYISVYDKMIEARNQYLAHQTILSKLSDALGKTVKGYDTQLSTSLGFKPEDTGMPYTQQLAALLKINDENSYDEYSRVVNLQNVKAGYNLSTRYPILESSVNQFRTEYNDALRSFLDAFREGLVNAKSLKDPNFLDDKLTQLIAQIDNYEKEYLQPDPFMKKIKRFNVFKALYD